MFSIAVLIQGMMLAVADSIYKVKLAYGLEKLGFYTEEPSRVSHTAMVIRVREEWATDHLPLDDLMSNFKSDFGITDIDNVPENEIAVTNNVTAENSDLPDLNSASLCSTFPYHILLDDKLAIKQTGTKLKLVYPQVCVGTPLRDSCKITYPNIPLNFRTIRQFGRTCFRIEILIRRAQRPLFLKGMSEDPESK